VRRIFPKSSCALSGLFIAALMSQACSPTGGASSARDTAAAGEADAAGFARYSLRFDGMVYSAGPIYGQRAAFSGTFDLNRAADVYGVRDVRDFGFTLDLGEGTMPGLQPYTVQPISPAVWAEEHRSQPTYGNSQENLAAGTGDTTFELHAWTSIDEGAKDTVLEDMQGPTMLTLWISCRSVPPEVEGAMPVFSDCRLASTGLGFYAAQSLSVSGSLPDHLISAEERGYGGPVELVEVTSESEQ
jgi:hypothetical protein